MKMGQSISKQTGKHRHVSKNTVTISRLKNGVPGKSWRADLPKTPAPVSIPEIRPAIIPAAPIGKTKRLMSRTGGLFRKLFKKEP